jgi:hypothetical protein
MTSTPLLYQVDSVTISSDSIKIRDQFGVEDGLDIDERPTSLSTTHKYNIVNQGWGKDDPNGSEGRDYVELRDEAGYYPANTDIAYLGKDPSSSAGEFNGKTFESQYFGTTPAPKGRFVIDAFDRGASRRTEFQKVIGASLSLPTDRNDTGLSTVAAAAGRIWYSGAGPAVIDGDEESPNIASFVFFTQTVQKTSELFKCYQEADPSSEHITDLVATDGGFITIPEATRIFKLVALGSGVLVFAENGVWYIHGGEVGFSATEFKVDKVANIGIDSKRAVVDAEGQIFFWAKNGIYTIATNEVTGKPGAQSLTEATIQTLYDNISPAGRRNAIGAFDKSARSVRWVYNDEVTYDGIDNRSNYNKELVFNFLLGAFTINTLDNTGDDRVADIVSTDGVVNSNLNVNVVDSLGNNVVSGGLNVAVQTNVQARGLSSLLYLTINTNGTEEITFSTYNNTAFKDWGTVDAKGRLITGFVSMGDNQRNKDIKSLSMHFNRTEMGYVFDENGNEDYDNPSSCMYRVRWNWSDSSNSKQWSDPEQAYILDWLYIPEDVLDTFDYGYSVITSKKTPRHAPTRYEYGSHTGRENITWYFQ